MVTRGEEAVEFHHDVSIPCIASCGELWVESQSLLVSAADACRDSTIILPVSIWVAF